MGALASIKATNRTKDDEDIFDVMESYTDLLCIFYSEFGRPTEKQQTATRNNGYSQAICTWTWEDHELAVHLSGNREGPMRVEVVTSSKKTLRTTRLIRHVLEVNPKLVLRRILRKQVNNEELMRLDKQANWFVALMTFISAFCWLLGLGDYVRILLTIAAAYVLLIRAYADLKDAVELRLLLVKTFWGFVLVGIPSGGLVGLAVAIAMFFLHPLPLTESELPVIFVIVLLVLLAEITAFGFHSRVEKKADAAWKLMTAERREAGLMDPVDSAAGVLYDLDAPSLMTLLVVGFLSIFVSQGQLGGDMLLYYVLVTLFVLTLFLWVHSLFSGLSAKKYRASLLPMARNMRAYSDIVREVSQEEERRRQYHVSIGFG